MNHIEITLILPAHKDADKMGEMLGFAIEIADLDKSGIDITFATSPCVYGCDITGKKIGEILKEWPKGQKQNHIVSTLEMCLKKYIKRYSLGHKPEVFVIYDDHTNIAECEAIISLLSTYIDKIVDNSLSLVLIRVDEPGRYTDSLESVLDGKIPSKINFHKYILGSEEDNDKIISSIKEQTAIAV